MKHFKTLSLDELRSPDFDLFSDQEEYSKEEVAETMEQNISKTRADYGSGIARPKIEDKDSFELKGQFLKELRDNTFSGLDHEDVNEHIEKVLEIEDLKTKFLSKYCPPAHTTKKMEEINNFQQEPDENLYQAWERFKDLFMKCPQHYLTEMQEVVLFYNGLDVLTRQIINSRGAIPSKTAADAKVPTTPKIVHSGKKGKHSKKLTTHNLVHLFKEGDIEKLLRDSIKGTTQILHTKNEEIRASTDAAIRNQGALIKTLEIQIGQMSKVLQERGFGSLTSSTETHPRDHVKSIPTIVEADSYPIRRMGSSQYTVSAGQNCTLMYETKQTTILFLSRLNGYYCKEKKGSYGPQFSEAYSKASHINNFIPIKEKDPGSFTLPCFINNVCFDNALADLRASVSVMPFSTYLNLGLGKLAHTKLTVELADRTVKYPKGIAENVLVGIGKFVFLIDFIILDMPEDIKVPLIPGRPILSTARAKIDVFKRKITLRVREEKIIFKSVKPASSLIKRVYMLSLRERMELDLEARLMGETLVLNRSLDPFFEDYIELNDLNVPLELRRDQVDDLMSTIEECEVIEEFRARNDASMVNKVFGYPSDCDYDKKIRIDCAYNLKFSCMIDFAVLEDMNAYRDERMGDDLAKRKENDNVGGESTIWKSEVLES
ncbi:mitochondrial proton/calcium exchanger protein-like protein isoform X1 [Tanacetum coccineum]